MKESYLGVDVCNHSYVSLTHLIKDDIDRNRQSCIVAVNPEKVLKAQADDNLRQLLNQATYQIPDGVGILIASKFKKGLIKERVTGIDMLLALCEMAEKHDKTVFLYGAKPGVGEKARENLLKTFPSLRVVGVMDGYEKNHQKILDTINLAKPDILFVGLGSPRQEYWILENMPQLNVRIFQGVGGSFDVLSGNIKRAPRFFRKSGLEWLYRLGKEPYRIKRQLKLPLFLFKVLTKG
ncbi:WecB/TagA/CpsF family glycosyltransferase [Lentibacillus saliphilus]|uniref:WecB/TagA/CpsF family glycosyltransferase n=1 Tax=Lentibacillus saliphilus TaxID=2737028 RepID=UPI001C3046B1|nr:WecB/TagA/CpsF family glycosyltransferase [Lentibacillus saliphilus]